MCFVVLFLYCFFLNTHNFRTYTRLKPSNGKGTISDYYIDKRQLHLFWVISLSSLGLNSNNPVDTALPDASTEVCSLVLDYTVSGKGFSQFHLTTMQMTYCFYWCYLYIKVII